MAWHEKVKWRMGPLGAMHAQWPDEAHTSASIHSEEAGLEGPHVPFDAARACQRCIAHVQSVVGSSTEAAKGTRLTSPLTVRLARLAVSGRVFWPEAIAEEFTMPLPSAQQAVYRAAKAGVLKRTADGYAAGYRAKQAAKGGVL